MTERFEYFVGNKIVTRPLPDACSEVLPGLRWGPPEGVFTPAYWLTQFWMNNTELTRIHYRIGHSLEEEVVGCLLGGYGIAAEVALSVFQRLRSRGLIDPQQGSEASIRAALHEPITVSGRKITYRFWNQKARYLAVALQTLADSPPPLHNSQSLRAYLLGLPGIGPKTASWIVRNWLDANDVAILDIHVIRAGRLMGLFTSGHIVQRDYFEMESRFLALAQAMNIPAAELDALIWLKMRETPRLVQESLHRLDKDDQTTH